MVMMMMTNLSTDDDDKPIDLSSTDEITVLINDAWEVIHDMGLE